jgi:hypothetical protein
VWHFHLGTTCTTGIRPNTGYRVLGTNAEMPSGSLTLYYIPAHET